MLQICMNQNLFLYAMIAAGVAGIWCLFWSNHFYATAIRDLLRPEKPKAKWSRELFEAYQSRPQPLANPVAFLRSRISRSRMMGVSLPFLNRCSQNLVWLVLAVTAVSLWTIYRYDYGRDLTVRYTVLGTAIAGGILLLRVCLDFGGKEEILLDGWTDYFENGKGSAQNLQKGAADRSASLSGTNIASGFAAVSLASPGKRRKGERKERRTGERIRIPEGKTEEAGSLSDPEKEKRISEVREGIRQSAAADSRFSGLMTPEEENLMREIIAEYLKKTP